MAFCTKCGKQLVDGAKFCGECGKQVEQAVSTNAEVRKTIFEGEIHKCPRCGWELKAFESVCPNPQCGMEIRGAKSSSTVREFAFKLEQAITEQQRILIIENFPVPNTKEDIFEFMILASSNFDASYYATHLHEENISDAWLTKIDQCYQKAKLILKNDIDLLEIQKLYERVMNRIDTSRERQKQFRRKKSLNDFSKFIPNVLIDAGWIISLIALFVLSYVNVDSAGFNACQLIAIIDLISGCIFIPKVSKCENIVPKLIVVIGLLIGVIVLIPLSVTNMDDVGFNAFQLLLIVDIIVTVIICCRIFRK